ncbi:hypothetical protein PVK06_048684 [Gossypium arboreum]|uniref:RNase H type-1 domain-containing protein n=1 Tax=Gossypium arboreum TaxID=29729 RepID=A0ABR0MGL8_GOSAR|nr:hypothetical protein PVK06_048684 [Gossypium arboreum]
MNDHGNSDNLFRFEAKWCLESSFEEGDPLSPYLFLICAEGFSTLIKEAEQKGLMRSASIGRERFSINHLFFADDCILFGDATCKGFRVVRDVIREYELVSGQWVNFYKSLIYFGANVESSIKEDITNLLGVQVASNPEKYLGLPMMVGRKKHGLLLILLIGLENELKCGVCAICQWEGMSARELIANGMLLRVGDGARINIWNDPWLSGRGNSRVSVQKIMPSWTSINQLIDHETCTWNKELVHTIVDDSTVACIFSIPIAGSKSEDMLVWKFEGSGECTVKSGSMTKEIWRPPDTEVIKINVDATFQSSVRLATTATLARDSTGEIVGAETYLFLDVFDAFVAEARACERALIFAGAMGFRRLIVEGRISQRFGVWVDGVPDFVKTMTMKGHLDWT